MAARPMVMAARPMSNLKVAIVDSFLPFIIDILIPNTTSLKNSVVSFEIVLYHTFASCVTLS